MMIRSRAASTPVTEIFAGDHVNDHVSFAISVVHRPQRFSRAAGVRGLGRSRQSGTRPEGRCIIYIVRRTQLYLDEDLWSALHARARRENTTISELVRQAVRERYGVDLEERRKRMMSIVGIWKDRHDIGDATEFVRKLRRGTRLQRLTE
jgi:hypothetical protein